MALSLFHPQAPIGHSAVFSPCRTWRYALERRWGRGPFVMFIGLNPSTADETVDDQTIRRCLRYGREWGFGGLLMTNLYGYRATDPARLRGVANPVGDDNDAWLTTCAVRSALVVAAWGAHPMARARQVDALAAVGSEVSVLRLTKEGAPAHPSRLPANLRPVRWTP